MHEHVAPITAPQSQDEEDNHTTRVVRPRLDQPEHNYLQDKSIGIVPVVAEPIEGTCAAQVVQGIPEVPPGAAQII